MSNREFHNFHSFHFFYRDYAVGDILLKYVHNGKDMSPLNILSSTVFASNTIHAYHKEDYLYGTLFSMLVFSSWCYHFIADRTSYFFWIDQAVITLVVSYGFYLAFQKKIRKENAFCHIVIFVTISIIVILYYYGYSYGVFCFHPEFGPWYHCMVHFFGSLSHHAILCLV